MSEYYIEIESRPYGVSRYKVCMEIYNQYCLIGRRLTRKANRCKKLEAENKMLKDTVSLFEFDADDCDTCKANYEEMLMLRKKLVGGVK